MARDREPQRRRQTIQGVKELILKRGLKPGDAMPTEAELVELLDASRSNVREAIRTLAALDILEVRHGTGMFVGQMSLRPLVDGLAFKSVVLPGNDFEALREVLEVRTSLDLALAPGIVNTLSGEETPELNRLCEEMEDAAQRNEPFAAADRAFHLLLAAELGNELYGQLVAAFWDVHSIVAPRLGVLTPRDIDDTARAHRAMLNAAVAGDLAAYRGAVHAHYEPLMRVLGSTRVSA